VNLFTRPNDHGLGSDSKPTHIPLVADVFAGVGPFAIPAAKRGAVVYANDLNQESTKWMEVNVRNNKVRVVLFTYHTGPISVPCASEFESYS
jgi:tRNA G26 N,N-dimethylase Trm1